MNINEFCFLRSRQTASELRDASLWAVRSVARSPTDFFKFDMRVAVVFSSLVSLMWVARVSAVCSNLEASLTSEELGLSKTCPNFVFQLACASVLNISWLDRAPLIYDGQTPKEKLTQHSAFPAKMGLMPVVMERAFKICCFRKGENRTRLNFDRKPRERLDELHQRIYRGVADIIVPVHSSRELFFGGVNTLEYVNLFTSPRLAVVVNRETLPANQSVYLRVISDVWPIAAVVVMLTVFSGIVLWALVSDQCECELVHFLA